jgi:hypothetical protein
MVAFVGNDLIRGKTTISGQLPGFCKKKLNKWSLCNKNRDHLLLMIFAQKLGSKKSAQW